MRRDKLRRLRVHTNTVSYLNCSAREDVSVIENKKNSSRAGEELGWGVLRGSRLGKLSDALGISRDLGPQDKFAAVRRRGREGRRVRTTRKTIPCPSTGNTFMGVTRLSMAKKIKTLC